MKRANHLIIFLAGLLLITSLTACSEASNKTNDQVSKDTESKPLDKKAAASAEDKNITQLLALLQQHGLKTGEATPGFDDIPDAAVTYNVELSGEEMLPLQIYKMEAGSDNLRSAQKKRKITIEFEGQKGEIDVHSKGDYVFFLAEGHPDQAKVFKLIDTNFSPN